jgi:hypothetical protein
VAYNTLSVIERRSNTSYYSLAKAHSGSSDITSYYTNSAAKRLANNRTGMIRTGESVILAGTACQHQGETYARKNMPCQCVRSHIAELMAGSI